MNRVYLIAIISLVQVIEIGFISILLKKNRINKKTISLYKGNIAELQKYYENRNTAEQIKKENKAKNATDKEATQIITDIISSNNNRVRHNK